MPDKDAPNRWAWDGEMISRLMPWLFNVVLALVVFSALSWWMNRNSLPLNTQLPPTFSLIDVNGQKVSIDFSKAERTLVYFIAPWCTVCHFSIGNVNWLDTWKSDSEAIYVVALAYENVDEISAFQAEHELTMPVLLGTPVLQSQFQVDAFPTYFVVDRQGRVQSRDRGYTTFLGLTWRF